MIIRRDQMRAFEAYMKASFEDRMVGHVRASFPDQYAELTAESGDDSGVRSLIHAAIDRSLQLGARRESSIQQMLEIMVQTSREFESEPSMEWTRAVLGDQLLSGGTRILLVHQKLPAYLAAAGRNNG